MQKPHAIIGVGPIFVYLERPLRLYLSRPQTIQMGDYR